MPTTDRSGASEGQRALASCQGGSADYETAGGGGAAAGQSQALVRFQPGSEALASAS